MHTHATCLLCNMTQGRNALGRDTAIGSSVTAHSELMHSHAACHVGNERQARNAVGRYTVVITARKADTLVAPLKKTRCREGASSAKRSRVGRARHSQPS